MDAHRFGRMLQEALDERGLSQSDLARQLGVSQASVSAWSTGAKRPSRDNAIAVEVMLDVRPRGRFLDVLGYATPADDAEAPMLLEDHVRADDTITAEDRRTLLRLIRLIRIANADRAE